jgi:hypothetical protein
MVRGIEVFRNHFAPFKDQFVLIGGAACDLLHDAAGLPFRATKDLDIVLCIELLGPAFVKAFWEFVREGGYERSEESSGRPQFYRFSHPRRKDFPFILELFSRGPTDLSPPKDQRFTRIPMAEDVSSLSAILLDDGYYRFLHLGTREVSGVPIVGPEQLILLKARAFLDLRKRKEAGASVDQKHITKHKNDVFRLFRLLDPDIHIEIPTALREDMREFLRVMDGEAVDLPALGVAAMTKDAIQSELLRIYCP